MEFFIYTIVFIIGTLIGSFCTLAVHRIPLKEDITHKRSYCPNCNHRLEFLDLIPVLSYVFLKGKCRYCKQKISPRYFIIEISFGIIYTLFVYFLNINWLNITINNVFTLVFGTLMIISAFLIIGIYKEHKKTNKFVVVFGIISVLLYMVYLYILHI